jgi:oligopeptide transport system substrate-binding protein
MKKRLSVMFSLLLVFSLFLSACGFNNDSANKDEKDTGSKDGGAAKQELRVNIKTEPFSLHPGLANDSVSGGVLRQTFEGLTRIGQDDKPENAMAEDVQVSEDGKTYTFKIREDATWTNGDPVVAKDFEYAWKWVLDPSHSFTT